MKCLPSSWNHGSTVKSTSTCKGMGFNSQNPCGDSHPSLTLVSEDPGFYSDLTGVHTCTAHSYIYTRRQNTQKKDKFYLKISPFLFFFLKLILHLSTTAWLFLTVLTSFLGVILMSLLIKSLNRNHIFFDKWTNRIWVSICGGMKNSFHATTWCFLRQ